MKLAYLIIMTLALPFYMVATLMQMTLEYLKMDQIGGDVIDTLLAF